MALSSQSSTNTLNKLPREVRDRIYELAFFHESGVRLKAFTSIKSAFVLQEENESHRRLDRFVHRSKDRLSKCIIDTLLLSKEFYAEALPVFVEINIFKFHGGPAEIAAFAAISPVTRVIMANLRRLEIELDGFHQLEDFSTDELPRLQTLYIMLNKVVLMQGTKRLPRPRVPCQRMPFDPPAIFSRIRPEGCELQRLGLERLISCQVKSVVLDVDWDEIVDKFDDKTWPRNIVCYNLRYMCMAVCQQVALPHITTPWSHENGFGFDLNKPDFHSMWTDYLQTNMRRWRDPNVQN